MNIPNVVSMHKLTKYQIHPSPLFTICCNTTARNKFKQCAKKAEKPCFDTSYSTKIFRFVISTKIRFKFQSCLFCLLKSNLHDSPVDITLNNITYQEEYTPCSLGKLKYSLHYTNVQSHKEVVFYQRDLLWM